MQTQDQARPRDGAMFFGRDELAEGLLLFRAGTLKMIRLQLAMEQRDRRVAIEAVDDLVALDRQLQDYLMQFPSPFASDQAMADLEDERAALNREKLALAAGVIRREPRVPPRVEAKVEPCGSRDFALVERRRSRRALRWVTGLVAVLAAAASVAFVPGVTERLQAVAAAAGATP